MAKPKLTAKQKELFDLISSALRQETAVKYIGNGYQNGTNAYLKACKKLKRRPSKNPETSASEILSYPNVRDFIASVKIIAAQDVRIDAAWVLKSAKRVFDRCMQDEPVIAAGEPTGEYKFEQAGANKALEIIGKHIDVQAFNEKSSSENTHKIVKADDVEW